MKYKSFILLAALSILPQQAQSMAVRTTPTIARNIRPLTETYVTPVKEYIQKWLHPTDSATPDIATATTVNQNPAIHTTAVQNAVSNKPIFSRQYTTNGNYQNSMQSFDNGIIKKQINEINPAEQYPLSDIGNKTYINGNLTQETTHSYTQNPDRSIHVASFTQNYNPQGQIIGRTFINKLTDSQGYSLASDNQSFTIDPESGSISNETSTTRLPKQSGNALITRKNYSDNYNTATTDVNDTSLNTSVMTHYVNGKPTFKNTRNWNNNSNVSETMSQNPSQPSLDQSDPFMEELA